VPATAALVLLARLAVGRDDSEAPARAVQPDAEADTPDDEPAGTAEPSAATTGTRSRRTRGVRVGALVAVALAAGLVTWIVVDRGNNSSSPSQTAASPTTATTPAATTTFAASGPAIVTAAQLRSAAASSIPPIYWAGAQPGTRIELTRTTTGSTFVRYLPPTARAGSRQPYLTVATYARPNGYAEVKAAAAKPKAITIPLAGGGIAVYTKAEPDNMHIAYPSQPYQIEVYSPRVGLARALTRSGAIRPVG
jgi:hypothetical protein